MRNSTVGVSLPQQLTDLITAQVELIELFEKSDSFSKFGFTCAREAPSVLPACLLLAPRFDAHLGAPCQTPKTGVDRSVYHFGG